MLERLFYVGGMIFIVWLLAVDILEAPDRLAKRDACEAAGATYFIAQGKAHCVKEAAP